MIRFLLWFLVFLVVVRAQQPPPSIDLGEPFLLNLTNNPHSQISMTGLKSQFFTSFIGIPYAQPPIGDLRFAVSLSRIDLILSKTLSIPTLRILCRYPYEEATMTQLLDDQCALKRTQFNTDPQLWVPKTVST